MATLYPESMLEDLMEAYFTDAVEPAGLLAGIISAGGAYKGFSAIGLQTPALIFAVSGSADNTVGNFDCSLTISIRCSAKEDGVRALQTTREAELRDICRDQEIEDAINAKAEELEIPLRVNFFDPNELTRGAVDEDFISAQQIAVEVFFK